MSQPEFDDDPLVRQRAEIDQALANCGELARAIRGIYESLVSEGFNESQALYLTVVQAGFGPGPLSPPK